MSTPSESRSTSQESLKSLEEEFNHVTQQLTNFRSGDILVPFSGTAKRGRADVDSDVSPPHLDAPKKSLKSSKNPDPKSRRETRSMSRKGGKLTVSHIPNPLLASILDQQEAGTSGYTPPIQHVLAPTITDPGTTPQSGDQNPTTHHQETPPEIQPLSKTESNPSYKPDTTYSVPIEIIDYLTGKSSIRPAHLTPILRRWYSDKWENLVDPHPSLVNTLFLACIPKDISNSQRAKELMLASNNLAMARYQQQFSSKEVDFLTDNFSTWVPFPNLDMDPEQHNVIQLLSKTSEHFLMVSKEILETVQVLQKDIDRNAFLFRSVCVDSTQGLREAGERVIRDIREMTETISTSTVPLVTKTQEKSTDPVIPPRPPVRRLPDPERPTKPGSVLRKPKPI